MAIDYSFTHEDNLLVVQASGFDESLAQVQNYGLAIIQACLEGGYTRVLCDETGLEYRLGTLDTFEAAEFIAGQAARVGKIAVVCNAQAIGDAAFWEDVVVNRDLTARVFNDVEVARRWLASKV